MPTTAVKQETVQLVANRSKAGEVEDAFREMQVGTMLSPQKWTIAALASTTAVDITSAAVAAAATPGALTQALGVGEHLRPMLNAGVVAVRVTAGAAAAGPRTVTDSGGTPSATVCTLSEDGKTLTFEAGVTGFVLEYVPRAAVNMLAPFATL